MSAKYQTSTNLCCPSGDGDSSVTEKLRKTRPYGLNRTIEKIECTNHICRNFSNKLKDLTTRKDYSMTSRNLLKSNLERMRISIFCAIKKRSSDDTLTLTTKQILLKRDLINTPFHVFGNHANCSDTSTRCEGHADDVDNTPLLQESGLWAEIINLMNNVLIKNINSLAYNVNNNYSERYNSVVAKFVGGKRVNFVQRDSYNARYLLYYKWESFNRFVIIVIRIMS